MPPQPVKKWAGIRDALRLWQHRPADPGRPPPRLCRPDPQRPAARRHGRGLPRPQPLDAGRRRPAPSGPCIVRFHGGGFYGGSSNSPGSDGEMLARFGDCVVITVNHRLSALGYLWLGDDGAFADSGAAGMQDLVACLALGEDAMSAAFGGDPDARADLRASRAAGRRSATCWPCRPPRASIQRAGVMSGSRLTAMTREDAVKPSDQLLAKLGLTRKDIRKLQDMPVHHPARRPGRCGGRRAFARRGAALLLAGDGHGDPDPSVHARRAGDVEGHSAGRLDRAGRTHLSRDAGST